MSSYIGIGFVYKGNCCVKLEKELRNVVNYLLSLNGVVKSIKFSNDKDGNLWINESQTTLFDRNNFLELLANGYYGELNMTCDLFELYNVFICIRIYKDENHFFGLLFDIEEQVLIPEESIKMMDITTEKIIDFINRIYQFSSYDYAFCDHNADIQYSPEEFTSFEKNIYSVVAIPSREDKRIIQITKSNWHIDGLTYREV
jgi:hypothetical protein